MKIILFSVIISLLSLGAVSASGSARSIGCQADMLTASRVKGYAPLAVHFGAVDSASGVIQPPDNEFDHHHYAWDFGDTSGGNWAVDKQSRNVATGFVAGHVFVEPGTYTVNLALTDDQQQVNTYKQVIEVLNPETATDLTTYYVATNGLDSNTGTTESTPFATYAHAMEQVGPNTRILFRRGDTWQCATGWIDCDGPGIIGAYGSGNKPVLQFTGERGIQFGWSSDNRDWRIVGLRFEGNGESEAIFSEGARLNQMLVWDVEIESWRAGIVISANCSDLDQNVVAASKIQDIRAAWTIYMGGTRSFIQGNHLDKQSTTESHTFRNYCANGFSATHNYFAPALHSCMKLHSPTWVDTGFNSENITITDNVFEGSNWTVNLGPQNADNDERVNNVRYERNLHLRTSNTSISLTVWAKDVTVQNNIFISNEGDSYRAVKIEQRGIEPPPHGTRVYNNTFFDEQGLGGFTPVSINPEANDTKVFNNLLAPISGDFIIDGTGSGLEQGNNLATDSPDFVNAADRDLRLGLNSPALNGGIDVGVLLDYIGTKRDATPDLGAFEYVTVGSLYPKPLKNQSILKNVSSSPFNRKIILAVCDKLSAVKKRIEVYNTHGKRIYQSPFSTGEHFVWDATKRSAGIYFIKAVFEEKPNRNKVFFLKVMVMK